MINSNKCVRIKNERKSVVQIALCILLITNGLLAAGIRPRIGSKAVDFNLKTFDSSPDQVQLDHFRGKFLILDFWATWCGSCLPGLEHLSQLQAKFPDNISVLAVTYESKDVLSKFFKHRSYGITIAINPDSSLFKEYEIQTLPHTVIIDPNGVILSYTYPKEITIQNLSYMIKGGAPDLKRKPEAVKNMFDPDYDIKTDDALYYAKIRPSSTDFAFGSYKQCVGYPDRRITWQKPVVGLLKEAWEMPSHHRIIKKFKNPHKFDYQGGMLYRLEIQLPNDDRQYLYETARNLIEHTFKVDAGLVTKSSDVKVLVIENNQKIRKSINDNPSYNLMGNDFSGVNTPLSTILGIIESRYGIILLDETGIDYGIDFHLDLSSFDKITDGLANYGLKLMDARRDVEFLECKEK